MTVAVYGLDLYGKALYGADAAADFSVTPMSAVQTGYAALTVYWTVPGAGDWSAMRLVRNGHGYPAMQDDGDVLLDVAGTAMPSGYADHALIGGRYYYYAVFLAAPYPAYSSTVTYQPGDTVASGGTTWICTAANTLAVTPAAGPAWSATNATALWHRAGQAMSLAVADHGYRDLLQQLTPGPYATAGADVSTSATDTGSQLYRYLSVLAWGLDMTRTELGEQQHLYRVDTMPISRMETLAREIGTPAEASITPRLRRYRVGNSALIGRRKGTLAGVAEAVYAATGYGVSITSSANRLLDSDQAESRWPRYPAWDPSVVYQPGDVVSYGGYLYSAAPSTVRVEAESLTVTLSGAPSSAVVGNRPSAVYSNNQQVVVQATAVGQTASMPLTIPVTGSYDLAVGMTRSYDYGITGYSVDGTVLLSGQVSQSFPPVHLPLTFDGYAAAPAPATSVYLGNFTLTAGVHTLTFTVKGRNPASGTAPGSVAGGYQIGVDYLTYTPHTATSIVGLPPTGAPTSNAYWSYYTAVQTHALDNPLTGGVSTWEQLSFTVGATASPGSLAEYSGYQALDGVGDTTANLTVMTNGTGVPATLAAHSIPRAKVTTWDAAVSYRRNAYVSYNGGTYLCLLPTQGDQPDADLTHWRPETISTTAPDRFLVSAYGLPLLHTPLWTAGAAYTAGQSVQYQGQRYIAALAGQGTAPTGRPTDNAAWAHADTAQDVYTASAWTSLYGGTTTATRSMYIEWYDAAGNLITAISPTANTQPDILATFARVSANLIGDLGADQELGGLPWVNSSADLAVASSGMAYWGTRTVSSSPGRHLTVNYGNANASAGLTFMTAPPVGVEHGLSFRWSSTTNFWAVSRTQLTKTVAGTTTALATWPSLPDGSRVYVTLQGSAIAVYTYQGPGLAPATLAAVTDSALSTATRYGIFERAL